MQFFISRTFVSRLQWRSSYAAGLVLCAAGGPFVSPTTTFRARATARDSVTPHPTVRVVSLDSLIQRARAINPEIRAAHFRELAARLRIAPAGARPDPTLMAGVQNLPLASPGFRADEMTMKMAGIGQSFPAPGKLARRARAARAEADAALAEITVASLDVEREVRDAYYDAVAATNLIAITSRGQSLLTALLPSAQAQYASGGGPQSDLIKARLQATQLAVDGAQLAEDRRVAVARLRATLLLDTGDRTESRPSAGARAPTDALDGTFAWPDRVLRAALGDTTAVPRFTAATPMRAWSSRPFQPSIPCSHLPLRSAQRFARTNR